MLLCFQKYVNDKTGFCEIVKPKTEKMYNSALQPETAHLTISYNLKFQLRVVETTSTFDTRSWGSFRNFFEFRKGPL